MKSYMARASEVARKWYVVDVQGKHLGRAASEVARILRGKHKPQYTPHVDVGDHVIVINADKVVLTGKKLDQKIYRTHTGRPGSMKETRYRKLTAEKPELAFRLAVRGMLPKNSLGRAMIKKMRVYRGAEHRHEAQKPEILQLDI